MSAIPMSDYARARHEQEHPEHVPVPTPAPAAPPKLPEPPVTISQPEAPKPVIHPAQITLPSLLENSLHPEIKLIKQEPTHE